MKGLWILVALLVAAPIGEADAKRRAGLRGQGHHHRRHHAYRAYPYYYGGPFYSSRHYGYYYDDHRPLWTRSSRPEPVLERGWSYLEAGDDKRALSVFARLARRDDADAHAKLGYAIASAELGDVDRGVWAMRHAAIADANALDGAPLGERVRERVRKLAESMHPPDHEGEEHGDDAHFLVAALLFAAGDVAGAGAAIDWAVEGGDSEPSTLALRDAIRARAAAVDAGPSSS